MYDHNKLMKILHFIFAFKLFKNICMLLMMSYFLSIIFYIFSDLMEYDILESYDSPNERSGAPY